MSLHIGKQVLFLSPGIDAPFNDVKTSDPIAVPDHPGPQVSVGDAFVLRASKRRGTSIFDIDVYAAAPVLYRIGVTMV